MLWHYTRGIHLRSILAERRLRLAVDSVTGFEKAAVWFTRSDKWPTLCGGCDVLPDGQNGRDWDMEECNEKLGIARIGVVNSAAPYKWKDHKRHSGIGRSAARLLEKAGLDAGEDPRDWRLSYRPVSSDYWLVVEVWDGRWVCIDPDAEHQWMPPVGRCIGERIILPEYRVRVQAADIIAANIKGDKVLLYGRDFLEQIGRDVRTLEFECEETDLDQLQAMVAVVKGSAA